MYISQRCGFGFDFQDAVFHDVADRDDADQLAILHDRQARKFAGGHHLHDAAHDFPRD
jgi:hypothetical protein